MRTLFGYLIALPFAVALFAWNGFILSKLWAWHVVPALHTPPLSYMQAVGLVIVYSFVTYSPLESAQIDELEGEAAVKGAARLFLVPGVYLFVGWLLS
jgi:hypothetical protein